MAGSIVDIAGTIWLSNLLCRSNSGSRTVRARAAAVFAISRRTAGSPPSLSPSQTLYKRYRDMIAALRDRAGAKGRSRGGKCLFLRGAQVIGT